MGGRLELTIVARGGVRLWGVAPVGRRAAIKGFGEGRFSEQTTHPAGRGDQQEKDGGEEGITGYETEGARDAIPDDVKRPRELREYPQHRTEGEASGRQRERGQKIPCAVVPALGEQDEGRDARKADDEAGGEGAPLGEAGMPVDLLKRIQHGMEFCSVAREAGNVLFPLGGG